MKVEIDSRDVERLEKNLSKLGDEAESTVNNVLHDFGVNTVKKDVTVLLPVSVRNKKHAKFSDPFTHEPENLGFIFKTKGGAAKNKTSWGYLVFPDEGRGPRNPVEQDFTGRGVNTARPKIIDELAESIVRKIEEVL